MDDIRGKTHCLAQLELNLGFVTHSPSWVGTRAVIAVSDQVVKSLPPRPDTCNWLLVL